MRFKVIGGIVWGHDPRTAQHQHLNYMRHVGLLTEAEWRRHMWQEIARLDALVQGT